VNHAQEIIEIPCDQIRIGERHRKDLGDLEGLAASMAREGLLQPIGITEDFRLVFGQRRFLAARDRLKWPRIPARVVRVSSLLAAEHDENEFRKSFTASERTAIASALEQEIGNRQGQRTDRELQDNCPEVPPGIQTREIVAQKAGFNSYKSYERAKHVVECGTPELVEAMDSGDLSISAAAVVAQQPADTQRTIVQMPAAVRRQIVRQLREATELPSTAEARRIARETGMLVADRTGRYRSGLSDEERKALKEDLDSIWAVTRAVMALAETPLDPVALASRLEYWHCPGIRAKSPVALDWLHRFEEAIREKTQLS
jgi:ParB family chromosome partitioning protein